MHFVYLTVDGSAAAFERFLQTHGRLLSALPDLGGHGGTPAARRRDGSGGGVSAIVGDDRRSRAAAPPGPRTLLRRAPGRRAERVRAALDRRAAGAFESTRLAFAEPRIEALFSRWMASGAPRLDPSLITRPVPPGRLIVRPSPHTYQQFGAFAGVL